MRSTTNIFMIALLTLIMIAGPATDIASGQQKLQTSMGGYMGDLDFPISWRRYYSYDEWTKIMRDMQSQYSSIADIQSIGTSRMGREMPLLTITNKATGDHDTKPAMWVDGAIHGNEVNGITCALYLAWYLLTRYDYDPYIYNLVNRYTFYILPGFNVDAADSYVRFPNTEHSPRGTYRPSDRDGDGLYDEDQFDDIDGDGEITMMYKEDPQGVFMLSPDRRRFIRVEDPNYPGLRFTRIGLEGFDNDGDGRVNEDNVGHPDLNRNFPFGWNLSAGRTFPLSEPESRAVFEFKLAHPNIFASFHYHNTGRLIMFQAPPSANISREAQQRLNETTSSRLSQMRRTNQYAQLFPRQVRPEYQHDMDVQTHIVTEGAYILKNYRPVIGGLNGQAHAASYYMLGAYAYLMELWGSPTPFADINNDGRVSDEEFMKWLELDLQGSGWIDPYQFDHPDYGPIWMGGTAKKHIQRTPPARYIEKEAEKNILFLLYCVDQFPVVEIENVDVEPVAGDLFRVHVTVANNKVYPTSSDMSVQLGRAEMDKLTANTSRNVEMMPTDGRRPGSGSFTTFRTPGSTMTSGSVSFASGEETTFRLRGNDRRTYTYIVSLQGNSGWMEFELWSKNGGTDNRRIELNMR